MMTERTTAAAPDFRERYTVLLDIGRILTGTLQPEELYRAIYQQAKRVLEVAGFYISLYDEPSDKATIVYYVDRGVICRDDTVYRGSDSAAIREARPLLQRIETPEDAIMFLGTDADSDHTRTVMTAPMVREGHVLGAISVQSYNVDAYDEHDLELLAALADLAAVALSNARYVAEMERRRREAERLEEIGRALSGSLELHEVLERVVVAALDLTDADSANVWLLRGPDRVEIAMAGGDAPLPIGSVMPVPQQLIREIVEAGKSIVFEDFRTDSRLPDMLREATRMDSGLAVPLVAADKVMGALSIGHHRRRTYSTEEIRLAERLSHQAAIAVENARLHEEIRTLSLTDPLTGLPNRRQLDIFLRLEFAAAQRGRKLTLIVFDVDRFKEFNDEAGHHAGDEVLRAFGRVLQRNTRAMSLAARYGGDEFVTVVPDVDRAGGEVLVQRIRESFVDESVLQGIRVSAGIASHESSMREPEDLMRAADQDMYENKRARETS